MSTYTYIYTELETMIFNYLPDYKFLNIDETIQEIIEDLHRKEMEFLSFCLTQKNIDYPMVIETFNDLLIDIKEYYKELIKYKKIKELLSCEKVKIYIENDTYFIKKDNKIIQVDKEIFEKYDIINIV